MIDGFKVDVTADELRQHLEARIRYHRSRADECHSKLQRLQTLDAHIDEEEEVFDMCGASRMHSLERMAGRHESREAFLTFARNHIVATEIYRLSEADMRLLEWLPVDDGMAVVGRF
jgi:hypothetical protein